MPGLDCAPVVVLAPSAFKGSLDARGVCTALARGLQRVWPNAELRALPMADGGEGTLDTVLAAAGRAGERRTHVVAGAGGAPIAAAYGLLAQPDGSRHAVLEIAQVVGITEPVGTGVSVSARSTRGVGELIRALLDDGLRDFTIGLGGSSTNDGGAGMLAALGLRFVDATGQDVIPTPAGLAALARVDAQGLDARLSKASITLMSDVTSPLLGDRGATRMFGPQKGVGAGQIALYDATLARYAALAEAALGRSAALTPGAGAAGGLGFALQLVGARVQSGAEVVAQWLDLDGALANADWAITGEGRSDAQTLLGKAPWLVARRARACGVPTTLISGAIDAEVLPELGRAFDGCFALPAGPATLDQCIAGADRLLADRAEQVARVYGAVWDVARRKP